MNDTGHEGINLNDETVQWSMKVIYSVEDMAEDKANYY